MASDCRLHIYRFFGTISHVWLPPSARANTHTEMLRIILRRWWASRQQTPASGQHALASAQLAPAFQQPAHELQHVPAPATRDRVSERTWETEREIIYSQISEILKLTKKYPTQKEIRNKSNLQMEMWKYMMQGTANWRLKEQTQPRGRSWVVFVVSLLTTHQLMLLKTTCVKKVIAFFWFLSFFFFLRKIILNFKTLLQNESEFQDSKIVK